MSTTPELHGEHPRCNSTLYQAAIHANSNGHVLSCRPKRSLDDVESGSTADPAAKRMTFSQAQNDVHFRHDVQYPSRKYPTRPSSVREAGNNIRHHVGSSFDDYADSEFDQSFTMFSDDPIQTSSLTNTSNTLDEWCSFGDLDSFVEKLDEVPPSSVLRGQDVESRSAEEFDSGLQFSSPDKSITLAVGNEEVPALEEEVDWNEIHEETQKNLQNKIPVESDEARRLVTAKSYPSLGMRPLSKVSSSPKAWVKKTVQTMSLDPDRTFFHLSEMMEAKAHHFKQDPNATFELFARVAQTRRENFSHKQHFQFQDLFREQSPYVNGSLLA